MREIEYRDALNEAFDEELARDENVVLMGADYFENPRMLAANRAIGQPNVGIGDGSVIRNAIIDKNARIGRNVKLTPEGLPEGSVADGLHVKDSILVVEKNAVVHNDFSL